ncbi:CocE/NonD family hydrolase [Microbulbifer magnicolonia]|uniref:CocE/NonD family hydrolase n=1 Tax=Microbulbifer magnicolonia TaxID=3109744 RepID=UPI002B406BE3|nr:CocE/NonD family hydrolase [Microbulbifer sp. GG15]
MLEVAQQEIENRNAFVVQRDVMVTMRDGVRLATDIYRPVHDGQVVTAPLPVIMERTPYNKSGISRAEKSLREPDPITRAELAAFFAGHGYVVVMQDCRGRYQSEGVFTKYINEAEDGYDTLCWLVDQPWCNGHIGTMGLSYGAHTQCALASLNPPGLACMFMDSGGFSSAFHGGIRRGGAYELKQATWAYRHALVSPKTQADPQRKAALERENIHKWFCEMPWRPGYSLLRAAPEYEAYLFELWQHGTLDEYWKRPGLYAEGYYDEFPDVPTAIVGSWYDPYVVTCLTNYLGLSQRKQSPVRLLMGPWTHGNRSVTHAGDVDFGPQSTLDGNIAEDYRCMRLAWFDRWLKCDEQVRDPFAAPVTYFQMGGGSGDRNSAGHLQHGGCWRTADTWPPAQTQLLEFYLSANGDLSQDGQQAQTCVLEYRFDPRDPVPTCGGALTSGEPVMYGGAFDQDAAPGRFAADDSLQLRLDQRDDVLVFMSEPLREDLIVTGPVAVKLWVSSDCPDTDFTFKLIDRYPPNADYPQGYAMNITDGIFRMRYREGWDRQVFMQEGSVYPVTIEAFATSNLFRKGHRVRVDISSSNFPHFDVNPNSGDPEGAVENVRVATNRIHLGPEYPCSIQLPVVTPCDPD